MGRRTVNLDVNGITSKRQALRIVVSLSKPTKMPGLAYSIPTSRCRIAKTLRDMPNSVCGGCYADNRGWYVKPLVKKIQELRYRAIYKPKWVDAMVFLIKFYDEKWFRWHDAGDLQDEEHLFKIIHIARAVPTCRFWLPTREYEIVRRVIEDFKVKIPENLQIQLSAHFFDKKPPVELAKRLGLTVSMVTRNKKRATCPAPKQGHKCLDCRSCWKGSRFVTVFAEQEEKRGRKPKIRNSYRERMIHA